MKNNRITITYPRRGFTLIELLVVIALTAILLVLVFRPLIDAFNLTSRAGTQIESQTAARSILQQITTDLSNAVYVYDNGGPNAKINLWLYDAGGNVILEQAPYGMVEYITPARQDEQGLDPNQGTDPTTGTPITVGDFAFPLQPGRLITRYFIGLRDNLSGPDTRNDNAPGDPETGIRLSGMPVDAGSNYHGYANRWTEPANAQNDNRFTLYKAVAAPYIPDPENPGSYIPNLMLFHTGTDINNPVNSRTAPLILDDPNFFYDNTLAGVGNSQGNPKVWAVPGWKDLNGDGKVEIWENWQAVATSQLQTNKADAVALDRDDQGKILYFDTLGAASTAMDARPNPRLLIKFTPASIPNDAGKPTSLDASGVEVALTAAPGYTLQHGAWANPFDVLLYRAPDTATDPLTLDPLTYYAYVTDPATGKSKIVLVTQAQNAAPPTQAQLISATYPDVGPQVNPATGFWAQGGGVALPQMAFTVDTQKGMVNFAFPQWVYVNDGTNRLPQKYDPAAINNSNTNPLFAGNTVLPRYVLLSDALQPNDSNGNPLNIGSLNTPLGIFFVNPTSGAPILVRVVPGAERVYGPDQRPGPHYGFRTLYSRVPSINGSPGQNEYMINYLPPPNSQYSNGDPRALMGYIQFDSMADNSNTPNQTGENPANGAYNPHSLPTLKFDAATQTNVPADPVEVEYQFQFNRPNDVLKADYTTRELIAVTLQSRLFDPATATAQLTDLTQAVQVRNFQR